jgi:hypothetical protein
MEKSGRSLITGPVLVFERRMSQNSQDSNQILNKTGNVRIT